MVDSADDLKRKCAERKALRERKHGKTPNTRSGNPSGRPKGGNLLQKMINEAKPKDVKRVYEALLEAGIDPDHRNFAHASKMLVDRWAHGSHFEKNGGSSTPQININIGDTNAPITIDGDVTNE